MAEMEKKSAGKKLISAERLRKIDRDNLPMHRFVGWLISNQPGKKYLVITEMVLAALLAVSSYIYFH